MGWVENRRGFYKPSEAALGMRACGEASVTQTHELDGVHTTTSSSPSNAVCVHEGMVTLNLHPGTAMPPGASADLRLHHQS